MSSDSSDDLSESGSDIDSTIDTASHTTFYNLRPQDFYGSDVEGFDPGPIVRTPFSISRNNMEGGPSIKHWLTYQKVLSEGYVSPTGGLLALPRELRDMIYKFAVDENPPCEVLFQPFYDEIFGRPIPYYDLRSFPLPGNLLLTCKQIFLEAGSLPTPFARPHDVFMTEARFALPIPPEGTAEGDRQLLQDLDCRVLAQLPVNHLEVILDLQYGSKYHFSYHLGRWSLHYKSHASRPAGRMEEGKTFVMTNILYDDRTRVSKALRKSGRLVQLSGFNELFYDVQGSPEDEDALSGWYDHFMFLNFHLMIHEHVADHEDITIDHLRSCVAFPRYAKSLSSGYPWTYIFAHGSGSALYTRKGKAKVKAKDRREAQERRRRIRPMPMRFLSGILDHVRSKKK